VRSAAERYFVSGISPLIYAQFAWKQNFQPKTDAEEFNHDHLVSDFYMDHCFLALSMLGSGTNNTDIFFPD